MDIETANKLIESIIRVENKNTGDSIDFSSLRLVKHVSMYSNTKIPIYKLELNGKILSRYTRYKTTYKCITCDAEQTVNLGNIPRKANEGKVRCYKCKELDPDKRLMQSKFMTNTYQKHGRVRPKPKLVIITTGQYNIQVSQIEFNRMSVAFKEAYFKRHFTLGEFEILRSRIVSIHNGRYTNIANLVYCPHIIIHNQTKFNPYLYDPSIQKFIKPEYITYRCDVCHGLFTNRDLYIQKGRTKLLCNDCNLCNNVYKVRPMENIEGTRITYQSKMELEFINFSAQYNIVVENGPNLEYTWNNGSHKYRVDFYIPKLNALVEIKAEHCWHKKQIENGKWQAKIDAVNTAIERKIYSVYFLIFPRNFEESKAMILDKI